MAQLLRGSLSLVPQGFAHHFEHLCTEVALALELVYSGIQSRSLRECFGDLPLMCAILGFEFGDANVARSKPRPEIEDLIPLGCDVLIPFKDLLVGPAAQVVVVLCDLRNNRLGQLLADLSERQLDGLWKRVHQLFGLFLRALFEQSRHFSVQTHDIYAPRNVAVLDHRGFDVLAITRVTVSLYEIYPDVNLGLCIERRAPGFLLSSVCQ